MSKPVNVHDLKTNYSKYLEKVIAGDEVVLSKHGKVVGRIVPLASLKKARQPGALKGKVWVSEDFDQPLVSLVQAVKSKD